MATEDIDKFAEATMQANEHNVACVIAEFFAHSEYSAFYESHGQQLDGWPGVVDYVLNAAQVFDRYVLGWLSQCSEDEANNFDDILAVEEFVELLIHSPWVNDSGVVDMARVAVETR